MNPQSRGEVALQSSNPDDPPLMEFNYLTHPYDKESIIEAVRQAMQIKKTTTMAKYWKGPLSAPKSESTEDIWV
jgi:choline dehydrogenase-like flavoprotein